MDREKNVAAEIIDLDFYRKFRIILPVRAQSTDQSVLHKEKYYEARKPLRRKRKAEMDQKSSKKDS
jgi:hypothetical protein